MTKQQKEERLNRAAAHVFYFDGEWRTALRHTPKPAPVKTTRKKTRRVARSRAH